MNLDQNWIKKHKPCEEALVWLETQKSKDIIKVLRKAIKQGHYSWADWALQRSLSRPNLIAWACNSAELVLHIYEKDYPNDFRPRNAIAAARRCIIDNRSKARANAATAAHIAYIAATTDAANVAAANAYTSASRATSRAAAYAADAAANVAANAAAYAATNAAADAATAAAYAATNAAADAANAYAANASAYTSAAYAPTRKICSLYGLKLLKTQLTKLTKKQNKKSK